MCIDTINYLFCLLIAFIDEFLSIIISFSPVSEIKSNTKLIFLCKEIIWIIVLFKPFENSK